MAIVTQKTKETQATIDQHIESLRQQLGKLKNHIMGNRPASSIEEFDMATEDLITKAFGNTSMMVEAYAYAQLGEAGGLVNLTSEAPEGITQDTERESLLQRQRVLESCVADLEARRAEMNRSTRPKKSTGPRVADYMSKHVKSLDVNATLKDAAILFQQAKIGSALIEGADGYVGSITETELTHEVVATGVDPLTTCVKTCMREPLLTIESSEPIVDAVKLMKEKATRHVAVTENGTIIGVISVSDVIRYYSGIA
ncbi:MAG: CBS domain-containing protein [Nitrospirales bacterium]|nr:CBS domain-containing protein [Nitrospirales bacterium]